MNDINRGFAPEEFEQRAAIVQGLMHGARLDAILVTTEAEIRYFTGFHSQFFESPTRPWFVVVPQKASPSLLFPRSVSPEWLQPG